MSEQAKKLKIKTLGSTHIYQEYNKTLNLDKTTIRLVTEGSFVEEKDIAEQLSQIEKRYYFITKNDIVTGFREGKFKLLYNNKNYRLPNTIPAFLINTGKGVSCVVNVSNHTTVRDDGTLTIDAKTLFTLMQAGSITAKYVEQTERIKYSASICKYGTSCYSKMFIKVLNKMFSININPQKHDILVYLSSMFFLRNVVGRDTTSYEASNNNYALGNCKDVNVLAINDSIKNFQSKDFENIDTFIKALAENVPGLSDLTTRGFLDAYMTNYGPTTLLGLEYLPIFLYNIFAIVVGSFINNQHALETLLGKDIDMLYKAYFN